MEKLSEEDAKELRRIYRTVVKSLHPDVNPDVTEAQIRLLENAVEAYKNGDLYSLRIIEVMVADRKIPERTQDAMSALADEKQRMESILSSIRESISEIKSRYPYTVKEIVEDSEKEKQRKEEIEQIIAQYESMIEVYTSKLNDMMR